jgi:hypothetical protein
MKGITTRSHGLQSGHMNLDGDRALKLRIDDVSADEVEELIERCDAPLHGFWDSVRPGGSLTAQLAGCAAVAFITASAVALAATSHQ